MKQEIIKQAKFDSLDDFVKRQNNFYFHFVEVGFAGPIYRSTPHFKRFQEDNTELEQELITEVAKSLNSKFKQKLPYELLLESYNIMSKLVYSTDPSILKGDDSISFLTR